MSANILCCKITHDSYLSTLLIKKYYRKIYMFIYRKNKRNNSVAFIYLVNRYNGGEKK